MNNYLFISLSIDTSIQPSVYLSDCLINLHITAIIANKTFENWELGNCIYVSISKYGSDTPVTRPETDKAGLSSRDRKRGGGKLKCY